MSRNWDARAYRRGQGIIGGLVWTVVTVSLRGVIALVIFGVFEAAEKPSSVHIRTLPLADFVNCLIECQTPFFASSQNCEAVKFPCVCVCECVCT